MNKWYTNQKKAKSKYLWKPEKDRTKQLQFKELGKMFEEYLEDENKGKEKIDLERRLGRGE